MRITFLPQRREVVLAGRRRVRELLKELELLPGTVMVIRDDELITEEDLVGADDSIEIRSVISGG
jgi:sulfur carrier protein ThiS